MNTSGASANRSLSTSGPVWRIRSSVQSSWNISREYINHALENSLPYAKELPWYSYINTNRTNFLDENYKYYVNLPIHDVPYTWTSIYSNIIDLSL